MEVLINRLGMSKFADNAVRTYSGGMKRKLSVAVSLLGDPPLVFMVNMMSFDERLQYKVYD